MESLVKETYITYLKIYQCILCIYMTQRPTSHDKNQKQYESDKDKQQISPQD